MDNCAFVKRELPKAEKIKVLHYVHPETYRFLVDMVHEIKKHDKKMNQSLLIEKAIVLFYEKHFRK